MKPIFYDPQRKRWKRLRQITDPLGLAITVLIVFFVYSMFRSENLSPVDLPDVRKPLKAVKEKPHRVRHVAAHRKTKLPPSQVQLNTDEGIRAAFYVPWDEGSFASLKEYYPQIDLLFPEWLHVVTPDGRLQALAEGNRMIDVVDGNVVRPPDDRHPVMEFLKQEKAQTEVFPLVNNFDPISNQWLTSIGELLMDSDSRLALRQQLLTFLAADRYRGVSLDFEEIPVKAQPGFMAFISELAGDLHARGMKLYVNLPPDDNDFDYGAISRLSDGIVLMDYDQHVPGTENGPVAAQDWYIRNLQQILKKIPRQKLIAGVGNYGYDWTIDPKKKAFDPSDVATVSVQEAWLHANESASTIILEPDSLSPHYGYMDGDLRHEVWYLDAVTALNEMRGARNLGINTFALWRLGAEDRSLWSIWDIPRDPAGPAKLRSVPPGHDIDLEGKGDILRIAAEPEWGWRDVSVSPDNNLITSETFMQLPLPYQLEEYGGSANKIAITFDDGPDPTYTPKMLEVLKAKNATATFFLIGDEAAKFPGLAQRIYDEGNEIGNHTFFHPDVSNLSTEDMKLQMNSTERFFEANLGVKPLFFRPPYAIDEEPDVDEQVEPLRLVQALGYITVGSKIDPHDWQLKPVRPTAQGIAEDVLRQVTEPRPQTGCFHPPCGNVVLLHDGGGDRSATVQALPLIIDGLRAHGFQIVPLSELIGKTRDQVMLPIGANERWSSIVSRLGFDLWYGIAYHAIILAFFFGNILMTARLLIIGALAIFDRLCAKRAVGAQEFQLPTVAVLIPAFNEEKVIVRTVEAVLACDYPKEKLRAFVIDDGSSDETVSVTEAAFPAQIASGRLRVISKPNAGKADALNRGLREVIEEVFVGIDADTVVAPAAIKRLVAHFEDAKVGAVAGNTKVGNRVNLWTRWQALEYITSQNFERRALDALGAVTVVPGALGAWRTEAVRKAGGYHLGTVAEDADLTMSLLEAGYRVEYEDRALAYTEAPTTANALMRQRFRWSFGILQAVWKHLSAFRRGGVLGWIALPNILIFQIILPIVSPAIDLMFFVGLLSYFADKHFHPATANPASIEKLALFFVIFLITDFIASLIAFSLERREDDSEDFWLLGQVWLQRFAYRQLFSLVLFKTVKRAIDGRPFSWDKLERTAAVRRRQASASASS